MRSDDTMNRLTCTVKEALAEYDAATARAEAAEADARECRAERARYGDAMTEQLADVEAERDALRDEYRLLVERVKAVMPYAINTAAWVTLLVTIGVEPEDMHFSK
jgi:hypothetical protein